MYSVGWVVDLLHDHFLSYVNFCALCCSVCLKLVNKKFWMLMVQRVTSAF